MPNPFIGNAEKENSVVTLPTTAITQSGILKFKIARIDDNCCVGSRKPFNFALIKGRQAKMHTNKIKIKLCKPRIIIVESA